MKHKKILFLLPIVSMVNKDGLTFDDIEVEKRRFHYSKYPLDINDVDINKIMVFNKVSFGKKGFKYLIGYKDDDKKIICHCI